MSIGDGAIPETVAIGVGIKDSIPPDADVVRTIAVPIPDHRFVGVISEGDEGVGGGSVPGLGVIAVEVETGCAFHANGVGLARAVAPGSNSGAFPILIVTTLPGDDEISIGIRGDYRVGTEGVRIDSEVVFPRGSVGVEAAGIDSGRLDPVVTLPFSSLGPSASTPSALGAIVLALISPTISSTLS